MLYELCIYTPAAISILSFILYNSFYRTGIRGVAVFLIPVQAAPRSAFSNVNEV